MSTRALICYLDEHNVLTSTYNHYDGYDSGVGAALRAHYNEDSKAKEIANVGYISYLNSETGEWDAANTQAPKAIKIDRKTFAEQFNDNDLLDELIDNISFHENLVKQEMIDVNTFYEEILAIRDYIKAVRSNPLQYV